jgi:hypothetical protein
LNKKGEQEKRANDIEKAREALEVRKVQHIEEDILQKGKILQRTFALRTEKMSSPRVLRNEFIKLVPI